MERVSTVQRYMRFNIILFDISIPFVLWTCLLFISPVVEKPGSIYLGEEGRVGVIDHQEKITKMESNVAKITYLLGDILCHQKSSRSIFINGNQMPICARCLAIFTSFGFSLMILSFIVPRFHYAVYIIALIPLTIDGVIQLITEYESTNVIRLVTGTLAGFGSAGIISDAIRNLSFR